MFLGNPGAVIDARNGTAPQRQGQPRSQRDRGAKAKLMPRYSAGVLKSERATAEPAVSKLERGLATAAHFARCHAIAAIYRARRGDAGAALASAEILACLYGAELNLWPSTIADPNRDRLVLSNGDVAPALYAIAAHYGFCDAREALDFCKFGSRFQIAPREDSLAFIASGPASPGEGLSVAMGMGLGLKLQASGARVYALLGQAEAQAGEVWEAASCAARERLDNLCAIVEVNRRTRGDAADVASWPEPIAAKWRAFEWAVAEVDGHDIAQILSVLRRAGTVKNRPTLVVAHTVRGHGVPTLVDAASSRAPLSLAQAQDSLGSLGMSEKDITELLDGA